MDTRFSRNKAFSCLKDLFLALVYHKKDLRVIPCRVTKDKGEVLG
jgi:hypothetical protein